MKALFNTLHILSLQQINIVQIGIFMYHCMEGKSPEACLIFFTENSTVHHRFTRQHQNVHDTRWRINVNKCFHYKSWHTNLE